MNNAKLTDCALCGNLISSHAVSCPQCGHPVSIQQSSPEPTPVESINVTVDLLTKNLKTIGWCQRQICYFLLMEFLAIIFLVVLNLTGPIGMFGRSDLETFTFIIFVPMVAYALYALVCSLILASKTLKSGEWVIFLLLTFVCGYFFGLLYINHRATALIRSHGYSVGLLGANASQFNHKPNQE
jgi:hypothetical protein